MAEKGVDNAEVRAQYNRRVRKEGWLEMRSEHFKTWRRRYFVLLKDSQMFGYRKTPHPVNSCDPCHYYYLHKAIVKFKENSDHTRRIFTVTMPYTDPKDEEFTRTFSVENDEERENWANEINLVAFNTMEHVDCLRSEQEGKMSDKNQQDDLNPILE